MEKIVTVNPHNPQAVAKENEIVYELARKGQIKEALQCAAEKMQQPRGMARFIYGVLVNEMGMKDDEAYRKISYALRTVKDKKLRQEMRAILREHHESLKAFKIALGEVAGIWKDHPELGNATPEQIKAWRRKIWS